MLIPYSTNSIINAAPIVSAALTKVLLKNIPFLSASILPRVIKRNLNFDACNNQQIDVKKNNQKLQEKVTTQYKMFLNSKEAEDWAQKHFNNNKNNLTNSQIRSLLSYSWNKYGVVNQALRSDKGKAPSAEELDLIKNIQNVIKKSKIPENIIVYRMVKEDIFNNLSFNCYQDLIGQEIKEKGFLSTSLSLNSLNEWKDKHNVQIKIKVPKNSRGYYLGSNSLFDEKEILFDKDYKLKITQIKANKQNIYVTCVLSS